MIGSIPFKVPLEFQAGLVDGSIVRVGTLLKESGTGQILAHVQETGIGQQLLSNVGGFWLSPVASLPNLGANVLTNVQLHHLTELVGSLGVLQYVTLGVAVVGIGVTAASFALMNNKLIAIQKDLSAIAGLLKQHYRELDERRLREQFSRIHGLFEQADQAHYLINPTGEWERIAGTLAGESSILLSELSYMLTQQNFDINVFSNLFRSYALCNAGRVECLVLLNELRASRQVSADISAHYNALFGSMSPDVLASKSLYPHIVVDKKSNHRLRREYLKMEKLIYGVREIMEAASTKPLLLDALIEQKIDGRDYLEQLRAVDLHSIVCLPVK